MYLLLVGVVSEGVAAWRLSAGLGVFQRMTDSPRYEVRSLRPPDLLDDWDRLVDRSPQGCIFCRSWWLDSVCPNDYEILIVRKGGRIVAGMPLTYAESADRRIIRMPPLTQTLGPLVAPSGKKTYERRLSQEMGLVAALVQAIPQFRYFSMRFHYNLTNWLPFYWAGYQQTTRYTYVLPDLTDLDEVFAGFAHMKRKNLKKAERLLKVRQDLAADDLYAHHAMSLRKRGDSVSYSRDLLRRIYDAARSNDAGKTLYAVDSRERIHAAILVVFDTKSAYYLISSIDPDYAHSGAATLLLRDAIAYVSRRTRCFDFEGSMIRNVEHSFRKFGAKQTPYFSITRDKRPAYLRLCIAGLSRARRAGRSAWRGQ